MGTKNFNSLMALAMLGICLLDNTNFFGVSDEERKELAQISKEKRKNMILSKPGVSEYTFEGFTVIARTKKNAIRKINNIKKQLENELIS